MKILLIILFICSCSYLVSVWLQGKTNYEEFVKFLRDRSDFETLEKIGARFHGEDLDFQMKTLKIPMEERLLYMFEKTKEKEYLDFLDNSRSRTRNFIFAYIAVFVVGVSVYLAFV